MKITQAHFNHMQAAIKPFDTDANQTAYRNAGMTDKRYRWDLARAAGLIKFMCDTLYEYANDDHIDTALRRCVKPLY